MTSLLSPSATRPGGTPPAGTPPGTSGGRLSRAPSTLAGILSGAAAAAAVLVVCAGLGVTGWYLSDTGLHGEPRDGMRVGAIAWLAAHGSGILVEGTLVTVLPWGLTALCAWTAWRFAVRLGEALWRHGPDAERIADGERDWTVPAATAGFLLGYGTVAAATARLAATDTAPVSTGRVLVGLLVLTLLVALPGVAAGSGRAAVWASRWPVVLRHTLTTARSVLRIFLGACAALVLVSLLLDWTTAANMLSRVGTDSGETVLYLLVTLVFTPNAVLLGGAYALGPGFAVGTGTVVSPGAVTLGPLPVFPLLAALPEPATTGGWALAVLALPSLVAAYGAVRTQLRRPTLEWQDGLVRGCGGGLLAGLAVTVLVNFAGGVVGPGRMQDVGAPTYDVLVAALATMGLGGLVGGALITWWQRRTSVPIEDGADGTPAGAP